MRVFGFSIAIMLFFAFASCDARADDTNIPSHPPTATKGINPVDTARQARPDARTKQTFDKADSLYMPRELAQQIRADQLEVNLINMRTDTLTKRVNDALTEYGTTIQDIDFDTGAIRRNHRLMPPAPVPPTSNVTKTRIPVKK